MIIIISSRACGSPRGPLSGKARALKLACAEPLSRYPKAPPENHRLPPGWVARSTRPFGVGGAGRSVIEASCPRLRDTPAVAAPPDGWQLFARRRAAQASTALAGWTDDIGFQTAWQPFRRIERPLMVDIFVWPSGN